MLLKDLIDKGRILENKINSSISTLLKKGFIKYEYVEVNRYSREINDKYKIVKLNEEQQLVVEQVNINSFFMIFFISKPLSLKK